MNKASTSTTNSDPSPHHHPVKYHTSTGEHLLQVLAVAVAAVEPGLLLTGAGKEEPVAVGQLSLTGAGNGAGWLLLLDPGLVAGRRDPTLAAAEMSGSSVGPGLVLDPARAGRGPARPVAPPAAAEESSRRRQRSRTRHAVGARRGGDGVGARGGGASANRRGRGRSAPRRRARIGGARASRRRERERVWG
ncbi:Os03g0421250, partial [Oryza sativa Japonica Group]